MSLLFLFICSCGLNLPPGVISLQFCSHLPPLYAIIKYITFVYVISPSIQLYTYFVCIYYLNKRKKRNIQLYVFYNYLCNYLIGALWFFGMCAFELLSGVICFQPKEASSVFPVRQVSWQFS